jgi:MOSC domain-containing protein YiiM
MKEKHFRVISVNMSDKKGTRKRPVDEIELRPGHGIAGDAHAGEGNRQVSLLAEEDIETMKDELPGLKPGDFAENITTRGIDLPSLPVGTRMRIGEALLEVTRIGKECHRGCDIMKRTGSCIMPQRGIFARVLEGGVIDNESNGTYRI